MLSIFKLKNLDFVLISTVLVLVITSIVVLNSIAPLIFPLYYLFILLGIVVFLIFVQIDFDIYVAFSKLLYILSVILLLIPLIIGQVTRGAIRWIPIGSLTLQPSELVRPFILLFFASILTQKELNHKILLKAFVLFLIPEILILIQPSLGVALITFLGFVGVLISSTLKKRYIFVVVLLFLISTPILWKFLAPYQQLRISSFLDPNSDPTGAGYNSIQAMISVGSGGLAGRGLGKGIQTQLAFLPEKHTDFVFAATTEEMGLFGATIVLTALFVLFWAVIKKLENSSNRIQRAFVSGVFSVLVVETFIHTGMNMGMLPITGVPLPFVSAGGSSFISNMITLAMLVNIGRHA